VTNHLNIALLKVPHSAMGKLRRSARRALGEVDPFNKKRLKASGRGFDSRAQTCCSSAYYQAIPDH
jgi:hypothetical protein